MINVLDNTLTVPPSMVKPVTVVLAGQGKPWCGSFIGIDVDHIIRTATLEKDPFLSEEVRNALHKAGVRGFIGLAMSESDVPMVWGYRFTDAGVTMMLGTLTWKELKSKDVSLSDGSNLLN